MSKVSPPTPRSVSVGSSVERQRFNHLVGMCLLRAGAKPPARSQAISIWSISTRAGVLYVTPLGIKILCRFEEPARASELLVGSTRLGQNGEWNFVFSAGAGRDQVEEFRRELQLICATTLGSIKLVRKATTVGIPAPATLGVDQESPVPPVRVPGPKSPR